MSLKYISYLFRLPVICMAIIAFLHSDYAMASMNLNSISVAINRDVCFDTFWNNNEYYQIGKTVNIVARQDGDKTYIWSNDLYVSPFVRQTEVIYTIFSKGGQSRVGDVVGFNTDAMRNTPFYKEQRNEVFLSGAERFSLHLPSDCTPHFSQDNQKKLLMLMCVMKGVVGELATPTGTGRHYSHHVKIIIANFNIDYPETYAFVPESRSFFRIALIDRDDPFSDLCYRYGSYATLDLSDTVYAAQVIPHVLKYGRIFWTP